MAVPPPYKDTNCPWNAVAHPWKGKPLSTNLPVPYANGQPWNDPRLPWQDPANP